MELREYWSAMGKRRWALLLVPVVAAGAAFAVGAQRSAKFEATSSVMILPLSTTLSNATVHQAAFDFQAIINEKSFADQVAKSTGVSSSKVSDGLTASQVGDSTILHVTFTSSDAATSNSVASAAGLLALQDFLAPQVSQAQAQVTAAQKPLADAQAAVAAYAKKAGVADPTTQLLLLQQVVQQLQVRLAAGEGTVTQSGIQQVQTQIIKLQPIADQFAVLTKVRDSAATVAQNAQAALVQIQAQQAAAPASVTSAGQPTKVSRISAIVQLVLAAAVIGFLVVSLLLLLGEVFRRDRQPAVASTRVAGAATPTRAETTTGPAA